MNKLRLLKNCYYNEFENRVSQEFPQQAIEQSYGRYPAVGAHETDMLRVYMEKHSLYILSQLPNLPEDLIFSRNGQERVNACLAEIQKHKNKNFVKLFSWEEDPKVR